MPGAHSRNKGAKFEREVANSLKPVYPRARRSFGQARHGGDTPDVVGTPWWLECCHGDSVSVRGKWRQAEAARAAAPTAELRSMPIMVVTREDQRETLVTLRLGDMVALLQRAEVGGLLHCDECGGLYAGLCEHTSEGELCPGCCHEWHVAGKTKPPAAPANDVPK